MTNSNDEAKSIWIKATAIYSFLLGSSIIIGLITSFLTNSEAFSYPKFNRFIALLIALGLGYAGILLLKKEKNGRVLFLLIVPWATLAIGSVFSDMIWSRDVPDIANILFLVYLIFVFFISRSQTLNILNVPRFNWLGRGARILLIASIVMFSARKIVELTRQKSYSSYLQEIAEANQYVQNLVTCDIPLYHYLLGFVLILILSFIKPKIK